MRKILISLTTATAAILSLSGCAALAPIEMLAAQKEQQNTSEAPVTSNAPETSVSSTSVAPPTGAPATKAPTSTREATSRSSSAHTKPSTERTRTVSIPADQKAVILDALTPIVRAHVTDPAKDKLTGKLKFDDDMKLRIITELLLNGTRVAPDSAAKEAAKKEFAKLSGTSEKYRFSELEFTFENNQLEAFVLYESH